MFSAQSEPITHADFQLLSGVPLLRREPRQQRTIILIKAVVKACHHILIKEGRKGVTAIRLSDLSGVAVASIYEWFESLDSIILYSIVHYVINRNYIEYLHLFSTAKMGSLEILMQELAKSSFGRTRYIYENCYDFYVNSDKLFMHYVENTVFIGENIITNYESPMHALLAGFEERISSYDPSLSAILLKELLIGTSKQIMLHTPRSLYDADHLKQFTRMLQGMMCY